MSTAIPRSPSGDAHKLMCAQQESKATVEKLRKLEEEMMVMKRTGDGDNMFNRAVKEEMKLHETK